MGRWSMPAKPSNVEYPGPASYYAAPSAPPAQTADSPPTAPPAYPPSTPAKESLYPKIHSPAQPGYPVAPAQGQYPPAAPAGYTSWPSGGSYQSVPPAYDSASYSPYTSEYTPYTPPAPPGGYASYGGPAPQYQSADPNAAFNVPPAPGYPSMPPYPQGGPNPYISPGPYGAPAASSRFGATHHDSLRLGGSGRDEDRFRANSVGNGFCTQSLHSLLRQLQTLNLIELKALHRKIIRLP